MALNLVSRRLTAVSGLAITTGSLLFSSVLLVPFSMQSLPDEMPGVSAWMAVTALGIGCTGLAYLMFYRLIARIGSEQTIMTAYLIPLFSLIVGLSVPLGEHYCIYGAGMLAGLTGCGDDHW